jgi:type I restriction enzyme M protein
MSNFSEYLAAFDVKFSTLETIGPDFYEKEIGVISFNSRAKVRDTRENWSEEYIRARFVYAMVYS